MGHFDIKYSLDTTTINISCCSIAQTTNSGNFSPLGKLSCAYQRKNDGIDLPKFCTSVPQTPVELHYDLKRSCVGSQNRIIIRASTATSMSPKLLFKQDDKMQVEKIYRYKAKQKWRLLLIGSTKMVCFS